MGRLLGELQLLLADAPPTEGSLVTEGGRTTTASGTQVTGSKPTAAANVFGYSEWTCRMLRTLHLLGADVPPLVTVSCGKWTHVERYCLYVS